MRVDLPPKVKARLDPAERYGLRLTLFGLAVVLVTIPFATLLFQVLLRGPATRADARAAAALNRWVNAHDGFVPVLETISVIGRPPVLAAVASVVAVWLWRTDRHRSAIFLVVTSIGGGIVDTLVKAAVNRPRPELAHPVATAFGKSFPSGHAMSSTVTYGAILVALWPVVAPRFRRAALVGTVILVLTIGGSRLFLGVHFVTDVIGGFVLGLAWLVGAVASFEIWTVEERRAAIRERRMARRRGIAPRDRPESGALPGI